MSYLPQSKFGDCTRCPSKQVACRKRGKDLVCIPCCNKEDNDKQISKSKERNIVRSLVNSTENKLVGNNAAIEFEKKESWFRSIRFKLTGQCQCGCSNTSSKKDDVNFRSSCCHLFPKRIFKSIQYHLDNYVERAFWGGCHTNFDEQSMNKWPAMADWPVIVEKFHVLAPLLTEEERSTKFYQNFENLIYKGHI